jgi:hypothetical protein
LAGRVHVTVHASPAPSQHSDEERGRSRNDEGGMIPLDVIHQRTDVEWRVEKRSTPVP